MGLFDGTALERPVTCGRCGKIVADCTCPRDGDRGEGGAVLLPSQQAARVRREKRRGKWTTVVTGLDASAGDLPAMLKGFQKRLGVGGTVRADGFELQGDHRDAVVTDLRKLGYPAKPAGG